MLVISLVLSVPSLLRNTANALFLLDRTVPILSLNRSLFSDAAGRPCSNALKRCHRPPLLNTTALILLKCCPRCRCPSPL